MFNMNEILLNSKIIENRLYLPDIQLDRNDYLKLSKELTSLGGKWKGGKVGAFVFDFDPQLIVDKICNNKVNTKKMTQFFPTPNKIVKKMLDGVEIKHSDKLLEPSAGQGAIIEELIKFNSNISYCEFEDINVDILKNKYPNLKFLKHDFLEVDNLKFDKIFANPPFSKSQDIIHIKHMYDLLNKDGVLVSISGTSWKYKVDKKSKDFKDWLLTQKHSIEDIESGEFSESGTNVATCLIKIYKNG